MNPFRIGKRATRASGLEGPRARSGSIHVGSLGSALALSLLFYGLAETDAPAGHGIQCHSQPFPVDSGPHDGTSAGMIVAFDEVVTVPGSPWLRLHFGDCQLGRRSYIVLTSLMDGGQQKLDAEGLIRSGNWSAYFNGEAVRVELHVASRDNGVFLRMEEITVGDVAPEAPAMAAAASCPDPRLPTTDLRVGRLVNPLGGGFVTFCTAWLASNGALVTAGHCVDDDPDGAGVGLPDHRLDLTTGAIVEFNVPASGADGTPSFAAPTDQYPIVLRSVQWDFPGYGAALIGADFAVFACAANSTTGLRPHQAQRSFFRVTNQSPVPLVETVSVTGYGSDSTPPGSTGGENASTLTLQTATATYLGEFDALPVWFPPLMPDGWYHYYALDSEGGSSGGPVIWDLTGFAIGINVAGGCFGGAGTSTENEGLEVVLQRFPGDNTLYVDAVPYPQFVIPIRNGSIFYPHDKVGDAVSAATAGANISIVAGSYPEALTISKAVTLTAPVGGVTIGQ